jgi:hypothetical protein
VCVVAYSLWGVVLYSLHWYTVLLVLYFISLLVLSHTNFPVTKFVFVSAYAYVE